MNTKENENLLEIVDVFTKDKKGGNKAGVVLFPTNDQNFQEIATKLQLSETVFVKVINSDTFELIFHTPKCKIDFCGHASLGAFYILKKYGIITEGDFIAKTDVGNLKIIVTNDFIFLEQDTVKVDDIFNEEDIFSSLKINKESIDSRFPIKIGYSGLRDILIPIKDRTLLNTIQIDKEMVEVISEKNHAVGYHIFSKESDNIYTRNFAPLYGIDEESATGSSNGALLGYLFKLGEIKEGEYTILQGENYKYPSKIIGKVTKEGKVFIGSEF